MPPSPPPFSGREVASDLGAIFTPRTRPASAPRAAEEEVRPTRRGIGVASMGAITAAAFAGLAAGVLLPDLWRGKAPPPVAAAPPVSTAPAPAMKTPGLVAARAVEPVAAPVIVQAVATPEVQVVRPQAVKRTTPTPRVESSAPRCCSHADVMAADRRLRRGYARAVDAGAPRAALVQIRREWASLRRHAPENPGLVIDGYESLRQDLAQLSGGGS